MSLGDGVEEEGEMGFFNQAARETLSEEMSIDRDLEGSGVISQIDTCVVRSCAIKALSQLPLRNRAVMIGRLRQTRKTK